LINDVEEITIKCDYVKEADDKTDNKDLFVDDDEKSNEKIMSCREERQSEVKK